MKVRMDLKMLQVVCQIWLPTKYPFYTIKRFVKHQIGNICLSNGLTLQVPPYLTGARSVVCSYYLFWLSIKKIIVDFSVDCLQLEYTGQCGKETSNQNIRASQYFNKFLLFVENVESFRYLKSYDATTQFNLLFFILRVKKNH